MRWLRDKIGALVPAPEKLAADRDPLEKQADAATQFYGFTDEERAEYLKLQRSLAGNPKAMKQLVKRQRMFARAARMSSTLKTRRR